MKTTTKAAFAYGFGAVCFLVSLAINCSGAFSGDHHATVEPAPEPCRERVAVGAHYCHDGARIAVEDGVAYCKCPDSPSESP